MQEKLSLLGYNPTLALEDTAHDRNFWLERPNLSEGTRQMLRAAEILIVPEVDGHDGKGAYFPEGTGDFYHFLQDQGVPVEVAVEDESFQELVRHNLLSVVGTFVINELLAPTFVGLVLIYLQNRVLNPAKSALKIDMIVQKADGSAKRLKYEGPVTEFETQIRPLLQGVLEEVPPAMPPQLPPISEDETP